MLYSKNGSIPVEKTDSTNGWLIVPEPPEPGIDEELVWWFPPGWVIRPIKPENTDTTIYKWNQTEKKWIGYERPTNTDLENN